MEADRPSRSSTSQRSWQRGSYRGRRRKRRRKPWGERVIDWTRTLIAFLFSNVGIVCLVVGYTIAGAFLFRYIEGRTNSNAKKNHDVIMKRNQIAATLWKLTSEVKDLCGPSYAAAVVRGGGIRGMSSGIYAKIYRL